MLIRIVRLLMQPGRILLAVMRRLPFGSYELRCALDLYPRPHYAYGVQQAAELARRLGVGRISVVEFGVAGGAGIVELNRMAALATAASGVQIDVYGFDTGAGLPKPTDHRDLPYIWREGDFVMDVEALRARLGAAHLILGDIDDTVEGFLDTEQPAPIGFVSIDVDFYSSTAAALKLFRGDHKYFLPRVFCYLDDTVGDDDQIIHNDYVGELSAIREFNEEHETLKLAPINGLRHKRPVSAPWNDNFQALHRFEHPEYGQYVGKPDTETQLPL
ncbi:hypothetical protein [Nonomuraea zeae]|uniref:Class I SAM-dependent methyltransferase n=1 Tax=Nonomuraea zeae TaxID=1642303 RepID=A0A5S4G8F6_9ACTN|nr:hypothetical protein [Nonomuraea zeae]TMR29298.1 hypothetical protein ETD85_32920 [Nonomuraea zeae]